MGIDDAEAPANEVLAQLPPEDWKALHVHAERVVLPTGATLHRPNDPISTIYFPDSGVVSIVGTLGSGQDVAIAAVGKEGFVGASALFGARSPYWMVVHVESAGYRLAADIFRRAFHESEALRRLSIAQLGRLIRVLAQSAVCNRFHSHHQRLARWLLVTVDTSGDPLINLTHDFIAHMVGGPRHAVTAALDHLKAAGAIDMTRGRIEVLDAEQLTSEACECYSSAGPTTSHR